MAAQRHKPGALGPRAATRKPPDPHKLPSHLLLRETHNLLSQPVSFFLIDVAKRPALACVFCLPVALTVESSLNARWLLLSIYFYFFSQNTLRPTCQANAISW
eukprot:465392-Pelagomonas_calceolata.AAC.1